MSVQRGGVVSRANTSEVLPCNTAIRTTDARLLVVQVLVPSVGAPKAFVDVGGVAAVQNCRHPIGAGFAVPANVAGYVVDRPVGRRASRALGKVALRGELVVGARFALRAYVGLVLKEARFTLPAVSGFGETRLAVTAGDAALHRVLILVPTAGARLARLFRFGILVEACGACLAICVRHGATVAPAIASVAVLDAVCPVVRCTRRRCHWQGRGVKRRGVPWRGMA